MAWNCRQEIYFNDAGLDYCNPFFVSNISHISKSMALYKFEARCTEGECGAFASTNDIVRCAILSIIVRDIQN